MNSDPRFVRLKGLEADPQHAVGLLVDEERAKRELITIQTSLQGDTFLSEDLEQDDVRSEFGADPPGPITVSSRPEPHVEHDVGPSGRDSRPVLPHQAAHSSLRANVNADLAVMAEQRYVPLVSGQSHGRAVLGDAACQGSFAGSEEAVNEVNGTHTTSMVATAAQCASLV